RIVELSQDANHAIEEFERWLEPKLGEGAELSLLAGWANKLAGACARLALTLHVAEKVHGGWSDPIPAETVARAIRLGKEYLLPHAQAAFGVMGADGRLELARKVWVAIVRHMGSAYAAHSADTPLSLTRRDIHNLNRRAAPSVELL